MVPDTSASPGDGTLYLRKPRGCVHPCLSHSQGPNPQEEQPTSHRGASSLPSHTRVGRPMQIPAPAVVTGAQLPVHSSPGIQRWARNPRPAAETQGLPGHPVNHGRQPKKGAWQQDRDGSTFPTAGAGLPEAQLPGYSPSQRTLISAYVAGAEVLQGTHSEASRPNEAPPCSFCLTEGQGPLPQGSWAANVSVTGEPGLPRTVPYH